ncbi:hypothetical protein WJX75_003469 [Coccomyxa subellipsoidea]|uniref:Uncharacterized protein n=1 Tax=Coccomyxa subellipsoidea TaxID=248742 RepID=A0ABR2Z330_9CHLO
MADLLESLSWRYASLQEVEKKRQFLMAACEEQLVVLKRDFFPRLAKEYGLAKEYAEQCKEPTARTIDDYEQLADLEFALIVWRQNLKRDLATTPSKEDKMRMARAAYIEAEKLVKRCLNSSHQSWNELSRASLRRPLGSPGGSRPSRARGRSLSDEPLGGDNIITVYERAMAQVWLRLEAIAQQHGVADALQMLVRMDRAASHPLNFTEVATALKEVTSALESGASPEAAQKQAMQKVARGGGLTPSASAPVSSSKAAYRLSIENEP